MTAVAANEIDNLYESDSKTVKELMTSTSGRALVAGIMGSVPVVLVADPGTSKTATIRALAKELGYTLFTIIASRMGPEDISGFPTKGHYTVTQTDPDGYEVENSYPVTEYAPQLWQREIMHRKKCLIFLDEWSNTRPDTRASLLSFVQDREFPNGEKFPDETRMILAMNPVSSAADGHELDPATSNRMFFVSWEPSVSSWLEGMKDNWGKPMLTPREGHWRNMIVRFISDSPGALHDMSVTTGESAATNGVDANNSNESALTILQAAWPSRRSWDNLSRVLGALPPKSGGDEDVVMQGLIGVGAATTFREWLQKNDSIDVKGILANPRNFDEWDTWSIEEYNILIKHAMDSVAPENVMNIVDIFRIIAEHEKEAMVAAHLDAFLKMHNNPSLRGKVFVREEKGKEIRVQLQHEVRREALNVAMRYRDLEKASRSSR